MKRDGGLVEAMGGCRPPTPAPAGWVRPWTPRYTPSPVPEVTGQGFRVYGFVGCERGWGCDLRVQELGFRGLGSVAVHPSLSLACPRV
jgi:hypothetical protein